MDVGEFTLWNQVFEKYGKLIKIWKLCFYRYTQKNDGKDEHEFLLDQFPEIRQ